MIRRRKSTRDHAPVKVILDWREYFYRFDAVHGGEPVPHGGRLLYRDGWRHSATDYAGPEFPPPEDPAERRGLQRAYWGARLAAAKRRRELYLAQLDALAEMQHARSAPLQQRVRVRDEDGLRVLRGDLSLDGLVDRARALKGVMDECLKELEKLK